MKKRGYLLIECIIYLGVCSLILATITTIAIPYLKEYKSQLEFSRQYSYVLATDIYINSRINEQKIKSISCNANEIYINMQNVAEQVDVIKKNKENLVVAYYKFNSYVSQNVLLREVEEFKVIDKENLMYVFIKQKNQFERVFCYEKK